MITPLSQQQVFDTVVNHLRQQGRKALTGALDYNGTPICAYRAADGAKCAAGILILDEEYKPEMENKVFNFIYDVFDIPALQERLSSAFALIVELQVVHDKVNVELWEPNFASLAKHYHLIYTPKAE